MGNRVQGLPLRSTLSLHLSPDTARPNGARGPGRRMNPDQLYHPPLPKAQPEAAIPAVTQQPHIYAHMMGVGSSPHPPREMFPCTQPLDRSHLCLTQHRGPPRGRHPRPIPPPPPPTLPPTSLHPRRGAPDPQA
ncbi:hypothetical protein KIL84_003861 [Mauremys mutica]|uniref:Uncharacterized protein n=1 Tax=Mauremys mutica TaxID=74926 RepID=A0A9D3WX92_9SAUR|nr:hypothetical protein KIL84_003861 [Mauremys mutica]